MAGLRVLADFLPRAVRRYRRRAMLGRMKLHPRLSRAAVELVKRFETLELFAVETPRGGWSIGYGHTATAREGARVDRQDAEALLLYDLSLAAELVERCTFAPLAPTQFEALTAFAFSIGPDNFRRSTALARVNAGVHLEAADEIERWRIAELGAGAQVVDALVRRRTAEKAHFLSLPPGAARSASPLMRSMDGATELSATSPPEPRSATRTAADNVQARLRKLIPEIDPAAEPERAPQSYPLAGAEPAIGVADEVPDEREQPIAPLEAAAPAKAFAADADPVRPPRSSLSEPPPPPFANDGGPVAFRDPLSEEDFTPAHPGVEPATIQAAATTGPHRMGGLFRSALAVLGLTLFVWAGVAIATGLPNLVSLAGGVAGAVMAAASLYSVLGVRRR